MIFAWTQHKGNYNQLPIPHYLYAQHSRNDIQGTLSQCGSNFGLFNFKRTAGIFKLRKFRPILILCSEIPCFTPFGPQGLDTARKKYVILVYLLMEVWSLENAEKSPVSGFWDTVCFPLYCTWEVQTANPTVLKGRRKLHTLSAQIPGQPDGKTFPASTSIGPYTQISKSCPLACCGIGPVWSASLYRIGIRFHGIPIRIMMRPFLL